MDFNNSGYPAMCYADSAMEFPDILLSVPPESLSKFPCFAVSGKVATTAKRLTTANECRAGKLTMAFAATYYLPAQHMYQKKARLDMETKRQTDTDGAEVFLTLIKFTTRLK